MSDQEFTPSRREKFVLDLKDHGVIGRSCLAVGVSRTTVARYRERDPAFDQQVRDAEEDGIDTLEIEARRRAVDGVDKPVFYKGEEVGSIREFSDSLLSLLLTRKRYNEKIISEVQGRLDVTNMTPEQKASALQRIFSAARLRKDVSDLT